MNYRLLFLVLIWLKLGLMGCSHEQLPELNKDHAIVKKELSIKILKNYLKSDLQLDDKNLILQNKTDSQFSELSIGSLDWQQNNIYVLNSFKTIEVPYRTTKNVYSIYKLDQERSDNSNEDNERIVNFAYSNLIFFKNKENIIQKLIVSYVPDINCIEDLDYFRTGKRMQMNTIDKEFSGYIEVKDWNLNVLKILRIDKGKLIKKYILKDQKNLYANRNKQSQDNMSQSSLLNCRTVCTPKYITVCASMPEAIDGDEICTLRLVGEECKQVCEDTNPDPDIPLPGGSGYTPPNGNQFLNQITNKPFALITNIPCNIIKNWIATAKHQAQQSQINKLNEIIRTTTIRSGITTTTVARLQDINDANSTVVNMDYYPVTISQLPIINGSRVTPEQFLHHIRININNFIETAYSNFEPYNNNGIDDRNLWNSTNPLNAVVGIDIGGPDNGSVIVSKYTTSGWTFSTIFEPMYGIHPVSGNRDFGYTQNSNGSYTFYTRGVDRLTTADLTTVQALADMLGGGTPGPFFMADNLWVSFQNKIMNFVNQNGGSSTKGTKQIHRPDWNLVKKVIKGELPLSSLSTDCPD